MKFTIGEFNKLIVFLTPIIPIIIDHAEEFANYGTCEMYIEHQFLAGIHFAFSFGVTLGVGWCADEISLAISGTDSLEVPTIYKYL